MPRPAESIAEIPTKMVNGMAKNTEIEQNGHSQSETHSRPPVIEEDLWEMERRKRVREVLGADDFRSELEQMLVLEDVFHPFIHCPIHAESIPTLPNPFPRI